MKVKDLIEKLQELPEDSLIAINDSCGNGGVVISHFVGNEYILKTGFEALKYKVISKIDGLKVESECVTIETTDGYVFRLHHYQDCCEFVRIVDVNGDTNDLIGARIMVAEERVGESEICEGGSCTWTFYTLRTSKGDSVDFRWLGESNGCYSESVDIDISVK